MVGEAFGASRDMEFVSGFFKEVPFVQISDAFEEFYASVARRPGLAEAEA